MKEVETSSVECKMKVTEYSGLDHPESSFERKTHIFLYISSLGWFNCSY